MLILATVDTAVAAMPGYTVYRPLDAAAQDLLSLMVLASCLYYLVPLGSRLALDTVASFSNSTSRRAQAAAFARIAIALGGATALQSILGLQLPLWSVTASCVALYGLSQVQQLSPHSALSRVLARLAFCGSVLATLVFVRHEHINRDTHQRYAQALAPAQDSLAVKAFSEFVQLPLDTSRQSIRTDWEEAYLTFPYLVANYGLSIRDSLGAANEGQHVIGAYVDQNQPALLSGVTSDGLVLELRHAESFRHSQHIAEAPYRGLEDLHNYHFAVVADGRIRETNTHLLDASILELELPEVGTSQQTETDQFDGLVYHPTEGVYVVLGEPLTEVEVWLANFALFFSLTLGIVGFVEAIRLIRNSRAGHNSWLLMPLEVRLQAVLVGSMLMLFAVVSSATLIFLNLNNEAAAQERQLVVVEQLRKQLRQTVAQLPAGQSLTAASLRALFAGEITDVDVYSPVGELRASSLASLAYARAPAKLENSVVAALHNNPKGFVTERSMKVGMLWHHSFFALNNPAGLTHLVAVTTTSAVTGTTQDVPVIMSRLLIVYVLLLALGWPAGLLLVRMVNAPLADIAERLQSYKLGSRHEQVVWPADDAVGRLTAAYNDMIAEVETASRSLVAREREGAWQTMAQQIAHEINNTLTPLRLNTQYIGMALARSDDERLEGAGRMAAAMTERIDHLASVAKQFNLFAQLEFPDPEPLDAAAWATIYARVLKQTWASHLLYTPTHSTAAPLVVLMDSKHLAQVLDNLISNALKATGKGGWVQLSLKQQHGELVIEVVDDGPGIPPDALSKLFDPTFTTTGTQTGLGLPVSRRIIEYFGGTLTCSTSDKGTVMRIELPLVGAEAVAAAGDLQMVG